MPGYCLWVSTSQSLCEAGLHKKFQIPLPPKASPHLPAIHGGDVLKPHGSPLPASPPEWGLHHLARSDRQTDKQPSGCCYCILPKQRAWKGVLWLGGGSGNRGGGEHARLLHKQWRCFNVCSSGTTYKPNIHFSQLNMMKSATFDRISNNGFQEAVICFSLFVKSSWFYISTVPASDSSGFCLEHPCEFGIDKRIDVYM